jgi:large subunit ribosomal protein L18
MTKITRVQKKRRRKNITDYNARLTLLKANAVRLVIRRTNRYIIIQEVESKNAQDKIIFGLTSKALIQEGWNEKMAGSLKSIPACYLTGALFAKKVDAKKNYIVDLGMARNVKGSRIFATVKGLIDGGLKLNADSKAFPSEKSLEGDNTKEETKVLIKKVKEKILGNVEHNDKKEIKNKVNKK